MCIYDKTLVLLVSDLALLFQFEHKMMYAVTRVMQGTCTWVPVISSHESRDYYGLPGHGNKCIRGKMC